MTFSILVRDAETGEMGCAAATGNLAVGAWVLRARAGVGLVATQGMSVSTLWGDEAIGGLMRGEAPTAIADRLVAADAGAACRQLTILNCQGHVAGWTGGDNMAVKSHSTEPNIAIAGNWLANADVLAKLKQAYLAADGIMVERLLLALDAAARAGSDSRGTMSAALHIVSPSAPPIDLRIDYSTTPVADLSALYEQTKTTDYREFLDRLPTTADPQRC